MSEHTIPAVDRAVLILSRLAAAPGSGIRELSEALAVPRSTVYRILNSLEAGGLVVVDQSARYRLGGGLLRLARTVPVDDDLVAVAKAPMDALAAATGSTVKLSVIDGEEAMVVAVAVGSQAYGVTTRVGRRFPLHAGAASKVLLAHAGRDVIDRILSRPLEAYTEETLCDPQVLRAQMETVRSDRVATDRGEYVRGVHAIAVPVFGPEGRCVAALSSPYLSGETDEALTQLKTALTESAKTISHRLGGSFA